MGEDDIVELLWKSGHIVRSSQTQTQTQRPSFTPPVLRGSGSGEENAPLPQPPPLQQPPDQNLFICEDEMASWLNHHPLGEGDEFSSHLFYSGVVASTPFTQQQSSVSLIPPPLPLPPQPPPASAERPMSQVITGRRAENFFNFQRLRGNIYTGGSAEVAAAAQWVPVVRDSTQVGSSATPSSSATESCLTPPVKVTGGVGQTFAVPSLSRTAVETVRDLAGPSSSGFSKTETEQVQIQPATEETEEAADERKRKEREEAAEDIEEAGGSTSRKRSRAAEMHNISERRRREKINEKMKALQELIPRCNKTDKASMLEDAIEYVKSLQMQIQMMSMGGGGMMPMMYNPNMQRFMPPSAMGMMGMNRPPFIPFPRPAHVAGLGSPYPAPRYPFPNIQAFDPSRVHLPSQQQGDPVPNQPQFPSYLNPYSQFVGLQQMQQPPPQLQSQTTSQLSFSQASSSKGPEDQDNKPIG